MSIKTTIEKYTEIANKINSKTTELNEVRQRLDDINNKDFFEITFDDYKDRTALIDYHSTQHDKLTEFIKSSYHDPKGTLDKQIANYIKINVNDDAEVIDAFSKFELDPNDKNAEENYRKVFDDKAQTLLNVVFEQLEGYFKAIGERQERVFKHNLEQNLPQPRSAVQIETKIESERRGIPFKYK